MSWTAGGFGCARVCCASAHAVVPSPAALAGALRWRRSRGEVLTTSATGSAPTEGPQIGLDRLVERLALGPFADRVEDEHVVWQIGQPGVAAPSDSMLLWGTTSIGLVTPRRRSPRR